MNLENMKRQLLSAIEGEKIEEQLEIYEELERKNKWYLLLSVLFLYLYFLYGNFMTKISVLFFQ